MVYGNYDPAYIQPKCDLCGKMLDKRYQYTPIKIETAFTGTSVNTAEHDGHLCNDCNELYDDDVIGSADELKFHLEGSDPARLLLVEVLGPYRTRGELKSLHKYGPDEAPEFLKHLAYGIAASSAGVRDIECSDPAVENIKSRYREVAKDL